MLFPSMKIYTIPNMADLFNNNSNLHLYNALQFMKQFFLMFVLTITLLGKQGGFYYPQFVDEEREE